jgi:hypothetical protein
MRIVSFLFLGIAVTSIAQAGQQTTGRPASQVIEQTDLSPGRLPWRLLRTTNQTDDRDTTTETEQLPDLDGRMAPVRETIVEVIRGGRIVRTSSTTFELGISGQRRLAETRESTEDSSADGALHATNTTRRSDVNGRLAITERVTEDSAITPGARRIERTLDRPDLNGQLRPAQRTEHTERLIAPQTVQATTTELHMDVNNRWQVTGVRNRDVRSIGEMEDTEETSLERDVNGTLWERERIVSRLTNQNGQENLLIERFTDDGRYPGSSSLRRTLSSRIRRTATTRADGDREIVEEVEERSPVAPDDPLRIVRRTVETVRRTGAGRWETNRQLFERDPNNRLVLTTVETEDTTER